MTKKEMIKLLKTDVPGFNLKRKAGEIDLRNADLRYADLRYADLGEANLWGADLCNADLRNADLRNADLRYADLRYADLGEANLRYANLCYANLREANLCSADLRGADLDCSAFPLWCGSFEMKTDLRLVYQLCYHICRLNIINKHGEKSKTGILIQNILMPFANKFHRVERCGFIEEKEK